MAFVASMKLFYISFLHRAPLTVRWMTVHGYAILVCKQPPRQLRLLPFRDGKCVLAEEWCQCCLAGMVTIGLTTHRPYIHASHTHTRTHTPW